METEKNVFITTDIIVDSETWPNWINSDNEYHDYDRFSFTKCELDKADYSKEDMTDEEFNEWCEENLSEEERFELPMMNALYYFPSFVGGFTAEDEKKCSGSTALLYDTKLEQWAVAMTGGGMDLSPHLVATFINLGKGVPLDLARDISAKYAAYVEEKEHLENCSLIGNAMVNFAANLHARGQDLLNDVGHAKANPKK